MKRKIELFTDHQSRVIKPIEISSLQILPLYGQIDTCSYINHVGKVCYANSVKELYYELMEEANKYLETNNL